MKANIVRRILVALVVINMLVGAAFMAQANQATARTIVHGPAGKLDKPAQLAPLSWVQGPIHTA